MEPEVLQQLKAASELRTIEKIKRLKARYFRLLDHHEWKAWEDCFTSDIEVQVEMLPDDPPILFSGRTDFVGRVSKMLDGVSHVHHGHMPEIDLIDDVSAKGIWAMFDHLIHPDRREDGYGHYHEQYKREADGKWRIQKLHLTRLRLEISSL